MSIFVLNFLIWITLALQVGVVLGGMDAGPVMRVGGGRGRDGNVAGESRGRVSAREAGSMVPALKSWGVSMPLGLP